MSAFQDFVMHEDQPQAPCLRCDDRAAGCHGTCRRYRAFKRICQARGKRRQVDTGLKQAEDRRFYRIQTGNWEHGHTKKK